MLKMVSLSPDLMNQFFEKSLENIDILINKMKEKIISALNLQELSDKSSEIIDDFLRKSLGYPSTDTDKNLNEIVVKIGEDVLRNILKFKFLKYLGENREQLETFMVENNINSPSIYDVLKKGSNTPIVTNNENEEFLERYRIINDDLFNSLYNAKIEDNKGNVYDGNLIIFTNIVSIIRLSSENQKKLSEIVDKYMREYPEVLQKYPVFEYIVLPF